MCGIAGLLGDTDLAAVGRMIDTLAHRGPNGIRVEAGTDYAFAHARLSIIDLEGGWQPMHVPGVVEIGNGEIYNYVELIARHGLTELRTGSDFEPLLHLWRRLGPDALGELRGMYALCVRTDRARVLARDPFGIKPLYVTERPGRIAFASEPRALRVDGPAPVLARERAEELLALNYTLGGETVFEGVRRLAPGEVVGASVAAPAFVARTHAPTPAGEAQALARLDAVLEDSVRVHQRSDVPYGLFLSGGVDSAAIATMMARLNSRPVTAYTCHFDDPAAADERGTAERVARALDLDWRETRFGAEDFWRIAPEVAWALDDPTTDFAALPTWKLAEAAKGTLTVVLTGEGGDELFGGYGRYRRALRPRWLGGRPAEPQVRAPFLKDGGAAALARWRAAAAQAMGRPGLTPLQQAQAADMATWLPNDLLLKLDRCLMAHGLEGRTPLLDLEVAEFAFHLPDRLKLRGRYGKWLLRTWLARTCPAADAWGRKQGFTVPVAGWIAPRAAALGPRVTAVPGVREVCDVDAVRAVFEREEHAAHRWPLLFFALWWSIHIAGVTRREAAETVFGDAFAQRSQPVQPPAI